MKSGSRWCLVLLAVVCVTAMPVVGANKTSGLNCTVTDAPQGIASDGNPYNNGTTSTSPKCFLGAGGKNFDLVTYSTGRTLKFSFAAGPDQTVANVAGLPPSPFNAEVDAYGINYYSQYLNMGVSTTAQVQMDVQFHYGGGSNTYELSYSCLAVTRRDLTTWVITSEPNGSNEWAVPCLIDPNGTKGKTGKTATLSKIRRNSVQGFGEVDMPITITFSPQ